MEEKRKHARTDIDEPAYVSSGGSVMSCVVRNISPEGAAIDIENPEFVPQHFSPGDREGCFREGMRGCLDPAKTHRRRLCCNAARIVRPGRGRLTPVIDRRRYFFSSGLSLASNSSNEIAPLTILPLMKKVGVASTLSCLAAKVSSAESLSIAD